RSSPGSSRRRWWAGPRESSGPGRLPCAPCRAASCATTRPCSCSGWRGSASTSCCRREGELSGVPPLSIMLWLPLLCGVLGALLPSARARGGAAGPAEDSGEGAERPGQGSGGPGGDDERRISIAGVLALVGSVASLALAIGYIADYNPNTTALQHVTDV